MVPMDRIVFASAIALTALVASSSRTGAHEGTPTPLGVFAPERRTNLVIATSFGLVSSSNQGRTWSWMCEQSATFYSRRHWQAANGSTLYVLAWQGLASSDDGGCSWRRPARDQPLLEHDVLPHPRDPNRLWLLAGTRTSAGRPSYAVYESADGARSFGAPLFTLPPDADPANLMVAPSEPDRVFLAMYRRGPPGRNQIARSDEHAGQWSINDVTGLDDRASLRLLAVDPTDPRRVYIALGGGMDESFAVSHDGGRSATITLATRGRITGFLRQTSGTIWLAAQANAQGTAYTSTDNGATFQRQSGLASPGSFAEQGERVYALSSNLEGRATLFASPAGETSFAPVMRMDEIVATTACPGAIAICRTECAELVQKGVFTRAVCANVAFAEATDAGAADGADGQPWAASPDAASAGPSDVPLRDGVAEGGEAGVAGKALDTALPGNGGDPSVTTAQGCGCRTGHAGSSATTVFGFLFMFAVVGARKSRLRRARREPARCRTFSARSQEAGGHTEDSASAA
jgi:hypothetical protein